MTGVVGVVVVVVVVVGDKSQGRVWWRRGWRGRESRALVLFLYWCGNGARETLAVFEDRRPVLLFLLLLLRRVWFKGKE